MTIKDIKKKKKAQLFKIELILKHGGKCCKCGYNNNLSNLCFHHKDPNNKLFGIDMHAFTHKSRKRILNESDKCELLCHHCHNDLHHPEGLNWKTWAHKDLNLGPKHYECSALTAELYAQ